MDLFNNVMKKSFFVPSILLSFLFVSCNLGTQPVLRRSGDPVPITNLNPSGLPSPSPSVSSSPKPIVDESEKISFMSNKSGFWDIYIMNSDGSNQQKITKDDMREPYPYSISPDGKRLAYISDKTGNPDLWVMDLNTKSTIQVTDTELADEGTPSWSSDSQSIAFHTNNGGGFYKILQVTYPLNDKGKNTFQTLISESDINALHPSFSPNGTKLLYALVDSSNNGILHVYDYETRKDKIITQKTEQPINGSWAPDSNKIIYWTNISGIYQINSDGTGNIQVGSIKNIKGTPFYSPDGKKITFARGYGFADDYDVWIMDNDGRNPKKITTEGGISLSWYKSS
jgi:Tol biopolymer transport system component